MDDPSTTISESDLTRLLPTCQRCRRLRRKCDTQLPACKLCQKGKAECTFFDHALQQTLPRSYVHSLLNRLARLRSVQATINGSADHANAAASYAAYTQHARPITAHSIDLAPPTWQKPTDVVSFDKHFIIEDANPTAWQFFGSSSAYSLAVEVLVNAQTRFGPLTHPENYQGPEFKFNQEVLESLERPIDRPTPTQEEVEMLVSLYTRSTNVINGYSDSEQTTAEIQTYLRHQSDQNLKALTGLEAHQFFRTAMICAIGAANLARHNVGYENESFQYYLEAVQCVEEVTSSVDVDSLQALLLLVLYVFFYPRRGDVWKLLDYACRLSVELNFHSETNDEYEDDKSRQRRRSLFWGLYSLERTFGQHVGRPSDLPEDIITVEYPANLTNEPVSAEYTQTMLMSHYYRLTYLRSEIFNILYMPALTPDLPRSWYEQRLEDFMTWQQEYQSVLSSALGGTATVSNEELSGMGSLQCHGHFHTSLLFLFQPILLRALAATKDDSSLTEADAELVIPKESYASACEAVAFYDRLYRAAEGTPEGDYPITIVSAHYIHQATLTILAHCLLAIDGRVPVASFMRTAEQRQQEDNGDVTMAEDKLDFTNLQDVAGQCMTLLERLATKWTGMVGILDIWREVGARVVPVLAQN